MNNQLNFINDVLDKNKDVIDSINNSIMSQVFPVTKRLYLDLATLKDTRLGLLLSLSVKDEFDYIAKRLKFYNKRPIRNFLFAFPELKRYTEEELLSFYHNDNYAEEAFNYSPDTDFLQQLPNFLKQLANGNLKAGYNDQIVVEINTFPLKKNLLLTQFETMLDDTLGPQYKVIFSYIDPSEINSSVWKEYDILAIDNISHITKESSSLYKPLLIDMQLTDKTVYAAPQVEADILDIWIKDGYDYSDVEETKERFKPTSLLLSICCKFQFTQFSIPLPTND